MKQAFEFNPVRPGPDHTSGQQRNVTAPAPRAGRLCRESRLRRRGFTFAEIMFAVMIMGIGFIMIAAMFPVAILQTQMTQEESVAASVAQVAMQYMQRSALSADYPHYNSQWSLGTAPKDRIQPLPITLTGGVPPLMAWDKMCGSMIFKQDPRYAWVPLYRRNKDNNYAQVVFFIVQTRLGDSYASTDVVPLGNTPGNQNSYPPLFPRKVTISSLSYGGDDPDTISFDAASADMLATGAFVVIGQTTGAVDLPTRIYRLGNQTSNTTYELAPGFGMSSAAEGGGNVEGWSMGRQKNSSGKYEGQAMDIGCYSSFIMLK